MNKEDLIKLLCQYQSEFEDEHDIISSTTDFYNFFEYVAEKLQSKENNCKVVTDSVGEIDASIATKN